jgi:hypothetical protein
MKLGRGSRKGEAGESRWGGVEVDGRMLAEDLRGLITWGRMVGLKAELCRSFCRRV